MPKYIEPKRLVSSYFSHLSTLENNAAVLYAVIANKVTLPSVQSALLQIASDSQKHSVLLNGLSEKIVTPRAKNIENETEFGAAFKIAYVIDKEISSKEKLNEFDLLALSAKLGVLEKILAEKYSTAHGKVTKIMARSVSDFQSFSLDSFNSFFERIAHDEEEHQKLLSSVEKIINVPELGTTEVEIELATFPIDLPHDALLIDSVFMQKGLNKPYF